MKKIVAILVLVVLVFIVGYLLKNRAETNSVVSKANQENTFKRPANVSFEEALIYECNGGTVVAVSYAANDSPMAELSLPNADPTILNRVESASGVKYTDNNNLFFIGKGKEAFVQKDDVTIYGGCKLKEDVASEENNETKNVVLLPGSETGWQWVRTTFADAPDVVPLSAGDFILTLSDNNNFSAKTDCNNIGGSYSFSETGEISFSNIVATEMFCEGDIKQTDFTNMLQAAVSYSQNPDNNDLLLKINLGGLVGEMYFAK